MEKAQKDEQDFIDVCKKHNLPKDKKPKLTFNKNVDIGYVEGLICPKCKGVVTSYSGSFERHIFTCHGCGFIEIKGGTITANQPQSWEEQWKKIEKEFNDGTECWEDFFKRKIEELLKQERARFFEKILPEEGCEEELGWNMCLKQIKVNKDLYEKNC
jgi:hypothetical protein